MVSLVDIADLKEEVEVRGQKIAVEGLSVTFIAKLLAGSNELRLVLAEKALTPDLAMALVSQVPDMVAEMIAAAVGKAGDPDTLTVIMTKLNPQEWLDLLEAIIRLTFPRGIRAFVEGLVKAARSSGLAVPGWDQAMKSPDPSPASSQKATLPRAPGSTRPDSSQDGSSLSSESQSSSEDPSPTPST